MKKLTAGIFSVLIGLCAADSAQAKIASEAWVNQEIGKVSTTVATNATNAADATKAVSDALDAYKTSNDAAVGANTSAIATLNADENTAGSVAKALADAKAYADSKAGAAAGSATAVENALKDYKTANDAKVNANASAIEILNGTGVGSVAKDIADAINALSADNGAIKNVADALATHEQTAANTYATKTALSEGLDLKENAANKVNTTTEADGKDKGVIFPTYSLVEDLIDNSAQGTALQISALNEGLAGLTTTVGNNKTAAEKAITDEVARAKAAEEANAAAIATETQRATGVESGLNTRLTSAEGSITILTGDGDGSVAKALADAKAYADEVAEEAAGDASAVAGDLAGYIASNDAAVALKADKTSLDATNNRVTTLETTVGDSTKGLVKAAADNATAAAAAAAAAAANAELISANAQAIEAEELRAKAAEAANTKAIGDEVTRAKAAEAANAKAIEDEVTRAKAAEAANTAAAAAAQSTADQAKATAEAAIPAPQPECSDKAAKCVLTSGANGYEWEVVTRSDENK